jgi:hypothetical protein
MTVRCQCRQCLRRESLRRGSPLSRDFQQTRKCSHCARSSNYGPALGRLDASGCEVAALGTPAARCFAKPCPPALRFGMARASRRAAGSVRLPQNYDRALSSSWLSEHFLGPKRLACGALQQLTVSLSGRRASVVFLLPVLEQQHLPAPRELAKPAGWSSSGAVHGFHQHATP